MHEEIKNGVWRHYKDKLYLVLGVAKLCFRHLAPFLPLGTARHSETGELLETGVTSWLGADCISTEMRLIVEPGETPPPRLPHVSWWFTCRSMTQAAPRWRSGLEMWQEEVEVIQGLSGRAEPTRIKVPRFQFVREH